MESSARRAVPEASRTPTAQPPARYARRACSQQRQRQPSALFASRASMWQAQVHLFASTAPPASTLRLWALLWPVSAWTATPASTRRRELRPALVRSAPQGSTGRLGLHRRFSTKQGGVEQEEVVHVQLRHLQTTSHRAVVLPDWGYTLQPCK